MEKELEKNNIPIMNMNLESCDVNAKGKKMKRAHEGKQTRP